MSKSQQQKEKETKGKVPNAYEVNPRLMEELSQITPENFVPFILQNPEAVPEAFRKAYWRNVKNFGLLMGANFVAGCGINMVITRTYPKFLTLPNWSRLPLRLLILSSPFLLCYGKLSAMYYRSTDMV